MSHDYSQDTLQSILDRGVIGIINQGGPAWANDSCLYRTPTGRKCMIGWSIDDEDYRPETEGVTNGLFRELWPHLNDRDIVELQLAHDRSANDRVTDAAHWHRFRRHVEEAADYLHLEMPNVRWPDDEQVD